MFNLSQSAESKLTPYPQLAVVVASISQSQSPLALGNILGSSISNILGAFSLGLVFATESRVVFDRSSKIYTTVLLGLTTFFALFILFGEDLGRVGGGVLVGTFVVYVTSIAWAIYKGVVAPPEDSDSDSDSDDESESGGSESAGDEESSIPLKERKGEEKACLLATPRLSSSSNATTLQDQGSPYPSPSPAPKNHALSPASEPENAELSPSIFEDADAEARLLPTSPSITNIPLTTSSSPNSANKHSTPFHLAHLTLGLLALSLSGYILSHTLSSLSSILSLDATVLGTTFLSLATTLPEKLISIMSARRGENGIVVANTVGSNVFLVTLCAGVLFLGGDLEMLRGKASVWEVATAWGSVAVLWGVVCGGRARRWMGLVGLGAYVVFLGGEFWFGRA